MERKIIGYLEATVRIPLYEGDEFDSKGPGAWWEYQQPGITSAGTLGVCARSVTEVSRRLLDADGKGDQDR